MQKVLTTTIIYNPISTGNSKKNAEELEDRLKEAGLPVTLTETEYAGHAEKLAKEIADNNPDAYIVSSSGDGSYNEVINGILSSRHPLAVAGLIPSGNANDHYNFAHRGDIVQRVKSQDIDEIDVLKVTTPSWTRYAHSYAGLGVTPQIGEVLTKHTLNPFNEILIVIKHLFRITPVKVRIDGRVRRYDHMVFSTVGKMSKYITIDENASLTDGLIEETYNTEGSLIALLRHFFRAAAGINEEPNKTNRRELTILRSTRIQLDGEVYPVKKGDKIIISCEKKQLRCIV